MSDEFGEDAFPDDDAPQTGAAHSHAEPEAELVFDSAIEFFVELLAPSYVRDVNEGAELAWCPEWYKHPEALIRVEALWRSWEHLRLEPALGISTWWLNHADPHMRVLMDTQGPFKKCAHDNRHVTPSATKSALPHAVPEAGIFD